MQYYFLIILGYYFSITTETVALIYCTHYWIIFPEIFTTWTIISNKAMS